MADYIYLCLESNDVSLEVLIKLLALELFRLRSRWTLIWVRIVVGCTEQSLVLRWPYSFTTNRKTQTAYATMQADHFEANPLGKGARVARLAN